jgi:hypothetical protein
MINKYSIEAILCKWKPSTIKKEIGVEILVKFSQNIRSLIEFTLETKKNLQFPQLCYLKNQNLTHKTLKICIFSCFSWIIDS